MSLLVASADLTHKSLESFIYETCSNKEAVDILELSQHPNFKTISDQAQKTWELFAHGTYPEYKNSGNKLQLMERQLIQLKKLTMLSEF